MLELNLLSFEETPGEMIHHSYLLKINCYNCVKWIHTPCKNLGVFLFSFSSCPTPTLSREEKIELNLPSVWSRDIQHNCFILDYTNSASQLKQY